MVTQEEKSARQQSSLVLWTWPGMSVQHFTAIHQITVKIFQSGPNWWTDWLKSLKPYAAGDAKKEKSISYFLMFDLVLVFVFWHHESVCWHLDDGTQLLTQQPWPLNHPGAAYSRVELNTLSQTVCLCYCRPRYGIEIQSGAHWWMKF